MTEPIHTRRAFLKQATKGTVSMLTLAALPLNLTGCSSDKINTASMIKLGKFSELKTGPFPKKVNYQGKVKNGLFTQNRDGFVYIVANQETGDLLFLSPLCTHLECPTTFANESQEQAGVSFYCPCHGGAFDEMGNNIAGPPERPLDKFKATVINDDVYLAILDPIKRE